MKKSLSYVLLTLVVLALGIYITREIAKSSYSGELDAIEAVTDSLRHKMEQIDKEVVQHDEVLEAQIRASKDVIEELKSGQSLNDEEIAEYEKIMDSLINELQED